MKNNNELTPKECLLAVLILLSITLGIRLIWAKFVYHDLRCAFAECRIEVSP